MYQIQNPNVILGHSKYLIHIFQVGGVKYVDLKTVEGLNVAVVEFRTHAKAVQAIQKAQQSSKIWKKILRKIAMFTSTKSF